MWHPIKDTPPLWDRKSPLLLAPDPLSRGDNFLPNDGRLTARKSGIQLDGGAYSDASALTVVKTGYRITGPYRWLISLTRVHQTPGGNRHLTNSVGANRHRL